MLAVDVCRRGKPSLALDAITHALELKPHVAEVEYRSQTSLNACAVLSELGRYVPRVGGPGWDAATAAAPRS